MSGEWRYREEQPCRRRSLLATSELKEDLFQEPDRRTVAPELAVGLIHQDEGRRFVDEPMPDVQHRGGELRGHREEDLVGPRASLQPVRKRIRINGVEGGAIRICQIQLGERCEIFGADVLDMSGPPIEVFPSSAILE